MPSGKTCPVSWFSSTITRILLAPGTVGWLAAGDVPRAAEPAGAAGEVGAGVGLPCPPQPAARQPASPAPASAASQRTVGMLGIRFTLSARSRWQATCEPAPGKGGERGRRAPPAAPPGGLPGRGGLLTHRQPLGFPACHELMGAAPTSCARYG